MPTMTMETRIKLTIGDLLVQLAAAQARIEELEEQLKGEPKTPDVGLTSRPTGNGKDESELNRAAK